MPDAFPPDALPSDALPDMAALLERPPAASRAAPLPDAAVSAPGVVLRVLPPMQRHVLRGSADAASACGRVIGVAPSDQPCRSAAANGRAALWLGPDEWLILLPDGDPAGRSLPGCLGNAAGAVVDVGHRQVALELHGPRAADVLNAGCPLDLHESRFPPGMCTRTVLGKTEVVVWRTAPDRFHLEVWRSFAAYAHALLADAVTELAAAAR